MAKTAVFKDDLYLEHDPGYSHVECPDRLRVIYQELDRLGNDADFLFPAADPASHDLLLLNHSKSHVDRVAKTAGRRFDALDPDTSTSPQSYDAACLAAGAVVEGVKELMTGEIDNGFALAPLGAGNGGWLAVHIDRGGGGEALREIRGYLNLYLPFRTPGRQDFANSDEFHFGGFHCGGELVSLQYLQASPGTLFGGGYPEQGAHRFRNPPLLADNPSLVLIGDLELEDQTPLVSFLGNNHCVRRINDCFGDVLD